MDKVILRDNELRRSPAPGRGCCDWETWGHNIHLVLAKKPRKLFFRLNQAETDDVSWLELHEDIHVAVGPEVLAEHGAEQCQLADVVHPTEFGDPLFRDSYPPSSQVPSV